MTTKTKRMQTNVNELPGAAQRPTCGKGLAENAPLPAKLAELVGCVAENLELHMGALDLSDADARREHEVYQALVLAHRETAGRLTAAAELMARSRSLPMGTHDEKAMAAPKVLEAFEKLVKVEHELLLLLEKRQVGHQEMLARVSGG